MLVQQWKLIKQQKNQNLHHPHLFHTSITNSDGYWNYSTMVLQFEDVVDVLTCLFGNTYEFFFILITVVAMIKADLTD